MIKTTYFGGDASNLGDVRRLPQTTFKLLVQQVFNVPIVLNTSREEYMAMDKKTRTIIKRVPYIVPAVFKTSPSKRKYEHATTISLLCLDIDDSLLALPYFNAPEVLAEQLKPFNFVVHTTASSTPEAPRVRIIVQADNLPLASYADALKDLARRIGLTKVNTESRVAVQPMYLPTLFRDDGDTHPVLVSEWDNRPYKLTDIEGGIPDNFDTPEVDEGLEFVRPILADVSLADVTGALAHIDPDCAYNDWLEVAMAMRHQFQRDAAEQAYQAFDEWSSQGEKYVGPEDTRAKWDSITPFTRNRAPLTIRTLLARAAKNGWDSRTVAGRCYGATMAWIVNFKGDDVGRLFQEGLKRIVATPLLSASEEETLVRAIVQKTRKLGQTITPSVLRKDLRKLKHEAKGEKKKDRVADWARGMCYIGRTNEFFRPSTGEQLSPEALDRVYGNKLLPTEAQLKEMEDDIMRNKNRPLIRPQDYLLFEAKVPTVYDTIYDPLQMNDTFIEVAGNTYVNTYVRRHPEPDPLRAEEAGKLWMNHLGHLIAEPDYRRMLMDYLAYIVQFPGCKIRYAVLIQGGEGCGKTFISEAMTAILGKGHVIPVDPEALRGSWNDWASRAQLVTLEEIRVAGQNRHEIMNRLKPLITNDAININQRFRDSRMMENRTNYLLFTNHHDALALTNADRRYFILKSPLQTREQVEALGGPKYFDPLYEMLRENASGLRAFFEQWPISKEFQPDGRAPLTSYFTEVLDAGTSDTTMAVRELIEDSVNPLIREDMISSHILLQQIEGLGVAKVTPQYIASILREEGYVRMGRYTIDGLKHPIWVKRGGPWAKRRTRVAIAEAARRLEENAEALL